jgi:hypothetical protein
MHGRMAANEECHPRSYQKHQIEETEHKLYNSGANVVRALACVCEVDASFVLW